MPAPAPGPVRLPENPGPAPVFVDDTGRRHRFVRGFGWILAAVITVYLALLTVSLVGSPGLVPLSLPAVGRVLPGPAAPLLSDGSRAGRTAGELVPTAATPAARVPAGAGTAVVSAAQAPSGQSQLATRARSGTPAPAPTTAPHATATPAPTPTHTSQGKSTTTTSPRPSHGSTTHPTPHSTHATGSTVTTSPTSIPTATP